MRYKIMEKASGEVQVFRESVSYVGVSGHPLPAAAVVNGAWAMKKSAWERLPVLFTCIEDARKYVQDLKQVAKLDKIRREEIIDV